MERKRPSRILIVVIILAVLAGAYYVFQAYASSNNTQLKASGTIEAVDVNVSPELSGKVSEVLAEEGQTVKAGDVLLKLDETLLQAQRDQA
ncbi:MAG TPA: biotin/lipoyl-binding protein, partial [Anaerolineales bacterium]|nr:biotin/lipoyl-binding protein [Anaerolineales bacterium]